MSFELDPSAAAGISEDCWGVGDEWGEDIARDYANGVGVASGELKASIHYKREAGSDEGIIEAPVNHAEWHEYGTMPHVIEAKNGKALQFMGRDGEFIYRRMVNHPGTAANDAFARAMDVPRE